MEALAAIELLLLRDRAAGPELQLAAGRELAARVVQVQAPGLPGRLAIAGLLLEARLPEHLQAGQEVRVVVRELSAERLTLGLVPPAAPEPARAGLPGGGSLQVTEREASRSESDEIKVTSLTVRYDAPNLGRVDLCFTLAPDGLRLSVKGSAGEGLEMMRTHLDELRTALRSATPTAAVEISSRRDLTRYA